MPSLTINKKELKRVKKLGFLINKGTDNFSGRVITTNGKINSDQLICIGEAAKKFGNGDVTFTSRMTVEVPGIPYKNIEDFRKYISKEGLITGGTGANIRPVVSCKGTTCKFGLADTFNLTKKIHNEFFIKWNDVELPHKFKIAMSGCPNNCVKPDLNDLGIYGQLKPRYSMELCKGCKTCKIEKICPMNAITLEKNKVKYNKELCINCGRCVNNCPFGVVGEEKRGYKITIGGMWGKRRNPGRAIAKLIESEEEVLNIIEKTMLIYREEGITGERLSDTIDRIGFEKFETQIYSDEVLKRKDKILKSELHVK